MAATVGKGIAMPGAVDEHVVFGAFSGTIVSAGDKSPPTWTILCCCTAIAAGTMFCGWRIVKTMGQKITKLKPVGGFCAETAGALPAISIGPGSSPSQPAHLSQA